MFKPFMVRFLFFSFFILSSIFISLKTKTLTEIYRFLNATSQVLYGIGEIVLSIVYLTFLAAVTFWVIFFYPLFYVYIRLKNKKSYLYLLLSNCKSLALSTLRLFYSGVLDIYGGVTEGYMTMTDPLLDVLLLGDVIVFLNIIKLLFDTYILEGIDNLLHNQKIVHIDILYRNYVGLYLEGRQYRLPPRNEYDFLFFLHDLENTNAIPENHRSHTSDNVLDQRQKLFVNKNGYFNLTPKQKRAIRKTRLLGRLGKLTCYSILGKYIFKPLVSLVEDFSISYYIKTDIKNFLNNKKMREKFIYSCIKDWKKRGLLGIKNYASEEIIKSWIYYYWEIGYTKQNKKSKKSKLLFDDFKH